jgi:hypothetical protein
MHLKQFYGSGKTYSIAQVAGDSELTKDIQTTLMWVGLLESTPSGADGKLGPITTIALENFQRLTNCSAVGTFDTATAKALLETSPDKLPKPPIMPGTDFAGRIVKYMIDQGYKISQNPGTFNIVYVEGVDLDGHENHDEPNVFNDLRTVIQIDAMGVPKIVGKWEATTEPGTFYTENRMDDKKLGAARIKFGQYKAWEVGAHKQQEPALIQASNVPVYRDGNEDYARTNDFLDEGMFYIDQHHANDADRTDIGRWSAGCLVGRTESGHEEFMAIIMEDHRYKANNNYQFEITIIPGDELNKKFPI